MMILDFLKLIFSVLVIVLPSAGAYTSTYCNRACGKYPEDHYLPSPFGFSPGCKIQLNCTSNSTVSINSFQVHDITPDGILVNLPAKCGRPIESFRELFSQNFAPTSHNGILLKNCSSNFTACWLPTTMVQTRFELQECGNDTISCYAEPNNQSMFLDYQKLSRNNCSDLFSAISVETLGRGNNTAVSLDVQLVQVGWWLPGLCKCSKHANCTELMSPVNGEPAYRCQCSEGYVGDGYEGGSGCWKESTSCGPSKYMSGECGGTTRVGVLVGGVAAGAALMIGLGLICCYIRKHTHRKYRKRANLQLYEATGITIPVYPYKEIEKATDFFSESRRLGNGAYGTVYSGRLQHRDEWVAIKRIQYRGTESIEQVINEIKLLSSVDHPNLVRLLGCSIEQGEQILVYEFMPNGTLSHHLQGLKGNGLPWPVRLTIAAETAQAIAYLHNAMHPPIFHRDIKSSNILLDFNFKSKVADFGLSRIGIMAESSHISTAPQGTPGYLDPQYHQDFHLSDRSDVYSFGVVLAEIITALKAVDFSRPQSEVNLAALSVDRIGKGRLDEIIDPFLEPHKNSWTLSSVNKVAELAFRCLAFHRDMRPSMMEVAIELEQIRLSQWVNSDVSLSSLSEAPSYSSSSNVSEKHLNIWVSKSETDSKDLFDRRNSMDNIKDYSPVSMMDSLPSEQSSPSSSSLLSHAIQ